MCRIKCRHGPHPSLVGEAGLTKQRLTCLPGLEGRRHLRLSVIRRRGSRDQGTLPARTASGVGSRSLSCLPAEATEGLNRSDTRVLFWKDPSGCCLENRLGGGGAGQTLEARATVVGVGKRRGGVQVNYSLAVVLD